MFMLVALALIGVSGDLEGLSGLGVGVSTCGAGLT